MIQDLFSDPEVVFIIQDIQVLDYGLIGEFIACKAYQLIKNREGIAHSTICFLCNDVQGVFSGLDLLLTGNKLKMCRNIIDCYSTEVEDLATGENGRDYLMFFCCCQDEFSICRRLFKCF